MRKISFKRMFDINRQDPYDNVEAMIISVLTTIFAVGLIMLYTSFFPVE